MVTKVLIDLVKYQPEGNIKLFVITKIYLFR